MPLDITDAEGNIGIYDGRARFKIDSYDKNIISWFYYWFNKNKIRCPLPKKIGDTPEFNKELWRIRVSKIKSLQRLFFFLEPHLKHQKRIYDLKKCINNINARQK
ncbi:MAG: hypothetical protein Q8N68_01455 [bacterium]|nr:hypothetical protein [bacterium]